MHSNVFSRGSAMQKMANIKIVIYATFKFEDKFWVPHKL